MSYVDGVVTAVPDANKEAYVAHADKWAKRFKAEGALEVRENWGEDVPPGKTNSLQSAVLLKDGETVVFSWIVWPDKATRDTAWGKIMEEGSMENEEMPYDGSRMIFGGFETVVQA